ncbi:MAG: hypothetical protein JSW67_13780 [Candidatus Latescibacterota bacterium]|nr:MAG: hypothetical protein JSW67_13780 [Candidatus Latescibacterota bacterium]
MTAPSRSQAHLLVAAIRVLEHQLQRPPSVAEIGEMLQFSKEYTGHLVRALEPHGIVHAITGPFEQRVEIRDHTKIEELPAEEQGPGFKDEVDEFHRQFEEKQKKLQNLFDTDELQQRQRKRFQGLDEELRQFKTPRHSNPFGDDSEEKH